MIIETTTSAGTVYRTKFSKPRMALRHIELYEDKLAEFKLTTDDASVAIEGRDNVINALKALVGSTV